jgi:hypothetical protein
MMHGGLWVRDGCGEFEWTVKSQKKRAKHVRAGLDGKGGGAKDKKKKK